jgi:hypothetical protein
MRKLREVLRLRVELKLGYQQIGRSCAIAVSTVHKYLKRAEAAGVSWPLPEDWDEARVEAAVFPPAASPAAAPQPARTPPDFAAIHEQLRSNKYVTLQLLWEEYTNQTLRLHSRTRTPRSHRNLGDCRRIPLGGFPGPPRLRAADAGDVSLSRHNGWG